MRPARKASFFADVAFLMRSTYYGWRYRRVRNARPTRFADLLQADDAPTVSPSTNTPSTNTPSTDRTTTAAIAERRPRLPRIWRGIRAGGASLRGGAASWMGSLQRTGAFVGQQIARWLPRERRRAIGYGLQRTVGDLRTAAIVRQLSAGRWLIIIALPIGLAALLPVFLQAAAHGWQDLQRHLTPAEGIAPFFAPSVQHWRDDLLVWATDYNLDPNLLATVMQIESCGHPTIASPAGAQGLFQVMPFHFEAGEDALDPATNAKRGASFLAYCLQASGGDAGLAMACYNGGPGVLGRSFGNWANETQRYYLWGVGMYQEAQAMQYESVTLNSWWQAGGSRLCQMAQGALG